MKVLQEEREGTKLQPSSVHWFWFLVRSLSCRGITGCRQAGTGRREGGREEEEEGVCRLAGCAAPTLPVLSPAGHLSTETDWSESSKAGPGLAGAGQGWLPTISPLTRLRERQEATTNTLLSTGL